MLRHNRRKNLDRTSIHDIRSVFGIASRRRNALVVLTKVTRNLLHRPSKMVRTESVFGSAFGGPGFSVEPAKIAMSTLPGTVFHFCFVMHLYDWQRRNKRFLCAAMQLPIRNVLLESFPYRSYFYCKYGSVWCTFLGSTRRMTLRLLSL